MIWDENWNEIKKLMWKMYEDVYSKARRNRCDNLDDDRKSLKSSMLLRRWLSIEAKKQKKKLMKINDETYSLNANWVIHVTWKSDNSLLLYHVACRDDACEIALYNFARTRRVRD